MRSFCIVEAKCEDWHYEDQATKTLKGELLCPESLLPDYSFSSHSCLAFG